MTVVNAVNVEGRKDCKGFPPPEIKSRVRSLQLLVNPMVSLYTMSGQTSHIVREPMPKTKRTNSEEGRTRKSADRNPVEPTWQIQTAKARFSELFRRARTEGPQVITRQGKEGVVMISDEHYRRLVGKSHQPRSLVQFFRESPLVGINLNLERDKDEGRDIQL